jgi:HEAT repeat protein
MWVLYAVALLPTVLGGVFWIRSRRITFGEWAVATLVAFITTGIFHWVALRSLTADLEVWSGRVVRATHEPEWTSRSGSGDERSTEHHPECWTVTADYGSMKERYLITEEVFEGLRHRLGATKLRPAERTEWPAFESGHPFEYVADNLTGVLIPTVTVRWFENRVKATPSLFSYAEVPEGVGVFDYPMPLTKEEQDIVVGEKMASDLVEAVLGAGISLPEYERSAWHRSGRLLGRATKDFDIGAWDALCSEVGPSFKVNLIAIGFDDPDATIAHWQEAAWLGGKKNDLVICYGPPNSDGTASWVSCFGWSRSEMVKRNLETLFLTRVPGDALIPAIRTEVETHHVPKEWPDFGYMGVEPPPRAVLTLLWILLAVQGVFWTRAFLNKRHRRAVGTEEVEQVRLELKVLEEERRHVVRRERERQVLGPLAACRDPAVLIPEMMRSPARREDGSRAYVVAGLLAHLDDPGAVTGLVVALTHDRFRVRELAAFWLEDHVPDPRASEPARAAIPMLVPRLLEKDDVVRNEARRVLGLIDPEWTAVPEAVVLREKLLADIHEGRSFRGTASEEALGWLCARDPTPLLALVSTPPPSGRALAALGAATSPEGVPLFLEALRSDDAEGRFAAARGLARFGPSLKDHIPGDTCALLLPLLAHPKALPFAARALGYSQDPSAMASLRPLTGDRSPVVRATALAALACLRTDDALSAISVHAGKDESSANEAIPSLARIGNPRALDILLAIQARVDREQDTGDLIKERLIDAFGAIGGLRSIEALRTIIGTAHDTLSERARRRLRVLEEGAPTPWGTTA